MNFSDLRKNLKRDFTPFPAVSCAILGDSATQFLSEALRGYGYEIKAKFDIYEAEFGQIEQEVFNPSSKLFESNPDFIIIARSVQKLWRDFASRERTRQQNFAVDHLEKAKSLFSAIRSARPTKIIYFNFPEVLDSVFGNYANNIDSSFLHQVRKINLGLMNVCMDFPGVSVNDVAALSTLHGYGFSVDEKLYVNADMVFSLDFLPVLAKNLADIIQAGKGYFKKCLILDLDNTLWGGVVGEDGLEKIQIGHLGTGKAFTEFQLWIKQLKNRGIILAVCSKNDDVQAREPFEKHPDMVLKLEDFALFCANWENKSDNIRYIQSVLGIGFDSMVFLDDSRFERNLVRTQIPEITVPELPEDPADYVAFLRLQNLFETASFTKEDEQRSGQYRQEAQRKIAQERFVSEEDYLRSLEMVSIVKPFDAFSVPRIAQLTQRSNQFNLRTVRYSEEDIQSIMTSDRHATLSFSLADVYGDYGLTGVVILEKREHALFIDTWIMSCRVLKRGLELCMLANMVECARLNNAGLLVGEYIPTPKNGMVKNLYETMGFRQDGSQHVLETAGFVEKKHLIRIVKG